MSEKIIVAAVQMVSTPEPAENMRTVTRLVREAADAGASLGGLTIQQSRGSDWQFPFLVERTQAFLGRPRQVGAQVPVVPICCAFSCAWVLT